MRKREITGLSFSWENSLFVFFVSFDFTYKIANLFFYYLLLLWIFFYNSSRSNIKHYSQKLSHNFPTTFLKLNGNFLETIPQLSRNYPTIFPKLFRNFLSNTPEVSCNFPQNPFYFSLFSRKTQKIVKNLWDFELALFSCGSYIFSSTFFV